MKKSRGIKGIVAGTSIALLVTAAVPAGLVVYALLTAGVSALRWWAGIATLVAVIAPPVAFLAGGYGAREKVNGIELAWDKLEKAAGSMLDLRGQAAAVVRQSTTKTDAPQVDPSRVVITHGQPATNQSSGQVVEM